MPFTFSQANPEFSGSYVAIADNDISTTALFDSKALMYDYIKEQLEVNGAEQVQSTVLGSDGNVDRRLNSKSAIYTLNEDLCYKGGPVEPEISQNIMVTYLSL
jgi:hypothetical protein